jgi:glycosyltransferase involved in cell wall biosynthesis
LNELSEKGAVAVLIPVFNGQETVGQVIRRCRDMSLPVLVVNDGSTDDTERIVTEAQPDHVLKHETNQGKGMALRTGFDFARQSGYAAVVSVDADGQHRPEEIPRFIESFERENPDIIVGNRFADGDYLRCMPWYRVMSNRLSSALIRLLGRIPVNDVQCGFRLYRLSAICRLPWSTSGYEFETEILLEAQRQGLRVDNLPVRCEYPDGTARSGYRAVRDSWRIAKVVSRSRLQQ